MAYQKKVQDVFAVSSVKMHIHVTVQSVQEMTYAYDIGDKQGEYHRLMLALGNLDAEDPFHSQLFFVLKEKSDPAYAVLAKAKAGDRGVLTLEVSLPVFKGDVDKKTKQTLYTSESTVSVQSFKKA